MRPPAEVIEVRDGAVTGWLVIDTSVDGLSFGGFRMTPTVTRAETVELARCMTWKLAGHGLPVGGAKAALQVDPRSPETPARLALFAERCTEALTSRVIVGKDMGATDALIDGLYASLGVRQLHVVTQLRRGAKIPDRLRDLPGYRRHMTGLGVGWAARAAAGGDLAGARVAIQGWGVVGRGSARRLGDLGADVIAACDVDGMVDVDEPGAPERHGEPGDVFSAHADILILAASSWSVDVAASERIRAGVVVEGANFGLTDEARASLHRRGVLVVPDVIASSSSAGMAGLQLASGGTLHTGDMWSSIEASIDADTRAAMDASSSDGGDLRAAHLRRMTALFPRAVSPTL